MATDARHEGALPGAFPVPVPALEQAREVETLLPDLVVLAAAMAKLLAGPIQLANLEYRVVLDVGESNALLAEMSRLSRENAEKAERLVHASEVFALERDRRAALETALRGVEAYLARVEPNSGLLREVRAALVGEQAAGNAATGHADVLIGGKPYRGESLFADVGEQAAEPARYDDCAGDCGENGIYCCDGGWDKSRPVVARSSENDDTREAQVRSVRDDIATYRGGETIVTDETLRGWERRLNHSLSVLPADEPEREHNLVVVSKFWADGYTCECSCGWRSGEMATSDAALIAGSAHAGVSSREPKEA